MSEATLKQKVEQRQREASKKKLLEKVYRIWVITSGRFNGPPKVNGLDLGNLEIIGDCDLEFDPTTENIYVEVRQNGKLVFEASGTKYSDGSLSQDIHAYVPGDWEKVIQENYEKVQAAYKKRAKETEAEVVVEEKSKIKKIKERFGLDD